MYTSVNKPIEGLTGQYEMPSRPQNELAHNILVPIAYIEDLT